MLKFNYEHLGFEISYLNCQKGYLIDTYPGTLFYLIRDQSRKMSGDHVHDSQLKKILSKIKNLGIKELPSVDEHWSTDFMALIYSLSYVYQLCKDLDLPIVSALPRCRLQPDQSWIATLPSYEPLGEPTHRLFVNCFSFLCSKAPSSEDKERALILNNFAKKFKEIAVLGVNHPELLRAAWNLGIPTKIIHNRLCRYGWGSNSFLMDSSVTEKTPVIAFDYANNKYLTKKILHLSGIPIVAGGIIESLREAIDFHNAISSPVVLKPLFTDRGIEVHVNLETVGDIKEAFESIKSCGYKCLIEEYYPSRDFRLHVCRGKVFRCIERVPGGVIGDGKSSIDRLIEKHNLNRRELDKLKKASYGPLSADKEAERFLQKSGLNFSSIPEFGQYVRLRGVANISKGGKIIDQLKIAHPDNLQLAISAAEALGLDLAGIDLLMPDISKSWLKIGAKICEVNSRPQIAKNSGGHEYILTELVEHGGRIPIDVIFGFDVSVKSLSVLEKQIFVDEDSGCCLVSKDGCFIDQQRVMNSDYSQFDAVEAMLSSKKVRHLLIAPWDFKNMSQGLPFDAIDRLILHINFNRDSHESNAGDSNCFTGCEVKRHSLKFSHLLKKMSKHLYYAESLESLSFNAGHE